MSAAAGGFLIGSITGGLVGFVLGWVKRLGNLFEPIILSLYTLPKIALAPLFVLWFGIGLTNKVMFSAMLVFFMVFFTTFQGTRQVDRDLVENARVLGANRWDIWTKIAIPFSAVWVFTGVRIGLPYALIGAIVGEFVAAEAGVGFRIKEATSFFDTASVFAGLLVLMLISGVLLGVIKIIERRVSDGKLQRAPFRRMNSTDHLLVLREADALLQRYRRFATGARYRHRPRAPFSQHCASIRSRRPAEDNRVRTLCGHVKSILTSVLK